MFIWGLESQKALIAGIGLLFAVGSAFSDVVFDDFDDGDSRNALGTYWYFYTDYAMMANPLLVV